MLKFVLVQKFSTYVGILFGIELQGTRYKPVCSADMFVSVNNLYISLF